MDYSILAGLVAMLKKALMNIAALRAKQTIVPPPVKVVETVSTPKIPKGHPDLLHSFCMAIQVYEGYIIPGGRDGVGIQYPSGSPAYRNKNPGNLRCIDGDRSNWNHLAVGCDNNFCVFPTYEIGFQALVNVTIGVARGYSTAYNLAARKQGLDSCADMDLVQYFTVRDPSSDGNYPEKFARFIARQIDVDISTFRMEHLL